MGLAYGAFLWRQSLLLFVGMIADRYFATEKVMESCILWVQFFMFSLTLIGSFIPFLLCCLFIPFAIHLQWP
jgi:hypothetical protein